MKHQSSYLQQKRLLRTYNTKNSNFHRHLLTNKISIHKKFYLCQKRLFNHKKNQNKISDLSNKY